MSDTQNLNARLAHLEDRIDRIEQAETATDADGQQWSVPKLVEMGLTRRQAMLAVGTLAVYGGSIWGAIKYATGDARAATDQVGTPSQPADVFADALSAEEAESTNETLVKLSLSSNITGNSSSNYTNPYDSADIDNRNEWDGPNNQFVPDKSGWYEIRCYARVENGSSGDTYWARIHNVDADDQLTFHAFPEMGSYMTVPVIATVELSAGTAYEINVRNPDSTYDINDNGEQTRGVISWSTVQNQ